MVSEITHARGPLKSFPRYPQDADTDENQGSLGFEEFCMFYKMISTRRDLYLIMISYSNQKEVMDLHDLARFLENEQKVQTQLSKGTFGWNTVDVLREEKTTFTQSFCAEIHQHC